MKEDNYDFLPVFGNGKILVLRRYYNARPGYRATQPMEKLWGANPKYLLPKPSSVTLLNTFEKIRDAAYAGIPIVLQIEIEDKKTGLSALIECHCKSMNISEGKRMYQTDTGPVILPDLSKRYDEPMDALRLAFIAFNAPHFADFVVEAPVPIVDRGKTIASVYHYSELVHHKAMNKVYAVE